VESHDYSGKFDPHFNHANLSKDALIELLRTYAEYLRKIDGFWYVTVMDRWGNAEALKTDLKAWERIKPYEQRILSSFFGLRGNDVATVMKYMQIVPWIWPYEHKIELIDENYGVFTKYQCPTLFAMESEGNGRERRQCQEVCPKGLEHMTNHFNPKIKIIPLKVPPRTERNGISCQWGFKLEEERS